MLDENPALTAPSYRQNLDNYFDMMENIEEINKTEYSKVQDSFDLIMSSFGCEICNYTFTTKLVSKKTTGFKLRFNFDNNKLIAKAMEPLEKINEALFGFERIFNWYYRLKGVEIIFSSFKSRPTFMNIIKLWKRCSSLSLDDYLQDKECEDRLKNSLNLGYYSYTYYLYNAYYEAMENMDKILTLQGKSTELDKYNISEDRSVLFDIFPKPKSGKTYPFERFYTEKRGIQIKGNEMNFKNSVVAMSILSIIYLLMSLV